jgi:hypothetical protein
MTQEFIPYQTALALKELGFDEPCFGYYDASNLEKYEFIIQNNVKNSDFIFGMTAPLYQQAFRWFREKYELSCTIELTDNSRHYYFNFTISNSKNRDYNDEDCFDSCKIIHDDRKFGKYEEVELACLIKLIEIVKTK